jgi:aquaporin Z
VNIRALVAEVVGTFILVAVGSLGVVTAVFLAQGGDPRVFALIAVPFTFGLGLLAAIAVAGHASGGHFNPAVTLAAVLDGRETWRVGLGYAVAQIVGGVLGSLAILLVSSREFVVATVNLPAPMGADAFGSELRAFGIETVLTAIFVAVILTVTVKSPNVAGVVIPLTLVGIHFAAMHLSGASVNPVRSLAPAAVSGTYTSLWVYLTAPFLGSILGWALHRFLTPPEDEEGDLDDEDIDEALGEVLLEDEER